MASDLTLINNPVELAVPVLGSELFDTFEPIPEDDERVQRLEQAALYLGFLGMNYRLQTTKAFVLDADVTESHYAEYEEVDDVLLQATLATYGKLHIGKADGLDATRALCLVMTNGQDETQRRDYGSDHSLFVPIFAVQRIERTN